MSNYGNEHVPQAPSGSRLAQYLNGRNQQQQQNFYPEQNQRNSSGFHNDTFNSSFVGQDNVGDKINDIGNLEANIPVIGLAVSGEETLKHRWANAGHGTFFTNSDIRNELNQRQLAMQCYQGTSVNEPAVVEHYRNLRQIGRTPVMRYGPTIMEYTYKGINVNDNQVYAIHRITNIRQISQNAITQLDNWRRITHSNIIRFHEMVHTMAFNDNSVLFVYDFHPLSETLMKHFFNPGGSLKPKYTGQGVPGIPETLAWSFIIQMSGAIRTIHSAKMASRCIDVNRIMVNSSGRFTISSSGIPDALSETTPPLIQLQIEDLRMFGVVLCCLLNGSITQHQNMNIDPHYTSDLRNVVKVLCQAMASPARVSSINEIMPMVGARFYQQIESLQVRVDTLENDLVKELQNGRLFRLLCILCTVSDRNLPTEPYWSEQSEQYMLKLLRNYIFHQVDPYGRPIIDLAHVVLSLNKLDSGVDELVQLASNENENLLLNSYKQLKSNLENSFGWLKQQMDAPIPEMIDPQGVMMPNPEGYINMNSQGYPIPFVPNIPPPQPPGPSGH